MPTLEELEEQIDSLTQKLNAALRRVEDLETFAGDHLGLDWGESLVDANSPHPNQSIATAEYGGGVMRLDSHGAQILASGGTPLAALWYLNQLSPNPLNETVFGQVAGEVTNSGTAPNIYFWAQNANAHAFIGPKILSTDAAELEAQLVADVTASLAWILAQGAGALSSWAWTNTYITLGALGSDPGAITDGSVYYYNNKLYARINGATVELGGGSSMPMPPIANTFDINGMGGRFIGSPGLGAPGSATWPTANLRMYFPYLITEDVTVAKLWCYNGATASGNVNMSLYDSSGTEIANTDTGSVAQSGTNQVQEFNITDTAIAAGQIYVSISLDNTTGTLFRSQISTAINIEGLQAAGAAQESSAFTAPSSATFAAVANNYIPLCGFSISPRTLVT